MGKINPLSAEEDPDISVLHNKHCDGHQSTAALCPTCGAAGWTSCLVLTRSEVIDAQQAVSSGSS